MTGIVPTRDDFAKAFPGQPRLQLLFEQLFHALSDASAGVALNVQATEDIQSATVISLSPNDALANERVLALDPNAFTATDEGPGGRLLIGLLSPIQTSGYVLQFNQVSDTYLNLPPSGTLLERSLGGGPYTDDADAAAGGIVLGAPYRKTGGVVTWRQT